MEEEEMKMKKVLSIVLVVILSASVFAGCGKSKKKDDDALAGRDNNLNWSVLAKARAKSDVFSNPNGTLIEGTEYQTYDEGNFAKINIGMTKGEVESIIGKPCIFWSNFMVGNNKSSAGYAYETKSGNVYLLDYFASGDNEATLERIVLVNNQKIYEILKAERLKAITKSASKPDPTATPTPEVSSDGDDGSYTE